MAVRRERSRSTGVSLLLEAAIGLGIFSIALLFLFGVFPMAHRSVTQSRNHEIATNLAKDAMEQELRRDYDSVQDIDPPSLVSVPVTVNGVEIQLQFEVGIQVDEVNTAPPDLFFRKNVLVEVVYREGEREGKVVLETSIFK